MTGKELLAKLQAMTSEQLEWPVVTEDPNDDVYIEFEDAYAEQGEDKVIVFL